MFRKAALGFLVGASALCFAQTPALSQESAVEDIEIEEIIVQARQRGEVLQDVPVSVAAFTAQDIDRAGITNMRDYAQLVPNFFLVETQNSSFTFANIRGITQMRNLDPSVAIVIDGVLSTTPISMSQELFDIQQIEVYKGPQGALYGRNAMAGAINIQTKRPSNEFEGFLRGGYGNGDAAKVQASVSGPIVEDKLFARIAANFYDAAGWRDNEFLGTKSDPQENISVRARAVLQASENFTADLRFSVSDDNSAALQFTDTSPILHEFEPGSPFSLGQLVINPTTGFTFFPPIPVGPAAGFGAAGPVRGGDPALLAVNGFSQEDFLPLSGTPGIFAALIGNINNTTIPIQNNLEGIDRRRIYNVSLKMDWVTSLGTITSITSYDDADNIARGEQPPRTSVNAQINSQFRVTEQISQELRITSPDDRRLRYIFGGYIQQTDAFLSTTVQRDSRGIDTLDTFVRRDPGGQECVGPPGAEFPSSPLFIEQPVIDCVRSFDGDEGDNLAFAIFGQLNYDVTEEIELSFSARYDRDERDQIVRTPNNFLAAFPTPLEFGDVRKETFDSFQPKATLRWQPNRNVTSYVSYAKGFRSGGFNRPGVGDLADFRRPIFGEPAIPFGIEDVFPKQETQSVEGGVKYNTPSGRLVVNTAAFYTMVDDYQTFTFNAFLNASQIIIPLEEVELFGVEVDATFQATEGLSFNAGFGYTDSEVKKDPFRNLVGNKAPQTPETTVNLGMNYQRPVTVLNQEGNIFLRVDYRRTGELFFMPENFVARDPLDIVNMRGGLNLGEGWQFVGWVRNLTDENYFAEGFNPNGLFFYGKLRQWGFELTKRF